MKNKINQFITVSVLLLLFLLSACHPKSDQTGNTSPCDNDSQPYWNVLNGHNFAAGEQGYYFINNEGGNQFIMYFDIENQKTIYLCNKSECMHNSELCNAYLDKNQYLPSSIWFNNGYLYLIKKINGNAVLVQMAADGSSRNELFEIGVTDGGGSYRLSFHDNYIFVNDSTGNYLSDDETTEELIRYSIDGKDKKIIYQYSGVGASIDVVKSYGDKLYFTVQSCSKTESDTGYLYDTKSLGIYSYDYQTTKVTHIIEDNISDYAVDESNGFIYYYVIGEGLYRQDLALKDKIPLYKAQFDNQLCQISYDGNYLYLDNQRWCVFNSSKNDFERYVLILNTDGDTVNKIVMDNRSDLVYFGDENYLFARIINRNSSNKAKFVYMNKNLITQQQDWSELN